ncbi:DoxX family protein [Longimycelium tulufanense]|uniref:DoxX family protein n=1 Tax=Longimycelium tulufanense TaxID=907463 RepID=UPI00166CB822|nr:DoxX family protein [Longimycelium tulufanense]
MSTYDEPSEPSTAPNPPATSPPADTARHAEPSLGGNAGADLGLLILRLVLGGGFIAHGAQKLFGAFDGPGIDGFARFLANQGFRQTTFLSWATGLTEFVGGILVVLGLFTPLGAAGILGVMISSTVVKWSSGYFLAGPMTGFEFDLILGAAAAALVLAGPGRVAVDNGRAWFRHPLGTGIPLLLVAVAAAVLVLIFLRN